MQCPKCGSTHTVKNGFKKLATTGETKQRWQCLDCGKYTVTSLEVFNSGSQISPVVSLNNF